MSKTLFAALAVAALTLPAHASDVLTQWNFNSPIPDGNTGTGTLLPSTGAGSAALVGGVTASFASGAASGGSSDPAPTDNSAWNTTTYAAQGSGSGDRGVQFAVSTLGFMDVVVSWDQRHSNTAAAHAQFQYSLDGLSFLDFGAPFFATTGDAWFNGRSVDLSGVAGVADNDSFAFRVVAVFAPGTSTYVASNPGSNYGTGGTLRFDMVTVSAMPIPEPGTYAMLLAGLLAIGLYTRRRT